MKHSTGDTLGVRERAVIRRGLNRGKANLACKRESNVHDSRDRTLPRLGV